MPGTVTHTAQRNIPALTGLRGFGAIWVVLYHLQAFDHGMLSRLGYLGVDLFFLLSGLVLTLVHARDFHTVRYKAYRRFLALRVTRIYPLHAAILLLMGLAYVAAPAWFNEQTDRAHVYGAVAFVANALLIQNWVPRYAGTWNLPAWSISIEFAAYLVFPFLMPAMGAIRRAWLAAALALLGVALFAAGSIATGHYDPNLILKAGFIRMAAEFGAGCLLCRAFSLGLRLPARATWAGIAGIALAIWPLHGSGFVAIPGFMLLLLLSLQGDATSGRLFGNRISLFLGEISYSIYLVHWPLIVACMHAVPAHWRIAVAAALIPLSYASYRLVEKPSRKWGRRAASRLISPVPATI
jgi:peptidoglycan/LPS O-acetylase OafA/YrhL